jgi:starch-binding outer membrane protein, SusD/RagB family
MKKLVLFLVTVSAFLGSCSDVLDKQPLDTINDATVWADQSLIDKYLGECYSEMRFFFDMPYNKPLNQLNDNNSMDAITLSDEALSAWGGVSPKSFWIGVGGKQFEWWGYPTVRKLNIFIEKIVTTGMPDAYKKQRLAEARFLRAFAYFNMVKRYGGVPLITDVPELNSSDEILYPKRNKEAEVYDFVLSEIDAISNDLPPNYNSADAGRPSKYAALALKSRVAMYAASIATWGTVQIDGVVGIPQSKAAGYWQASLDASTAVINSGQFALYNKYPTDKVKNFRSLFTDEANGEAIFSDRYDGQSGRGHTYDMINVPKSYQIWGGGQKDCVYLEMVESFDNIDGTPGTLDRTKTNQNYKWTVNELWGNKDPRFRASVYTHGTAWTYTSGAFVLDYHSGIIYTNSSNVLTFINTGSYKGVLAVTQSTGRPTNFGVLKYLDESLAVNHERGYSKTDYMVFRLGEMYLNQAEAAIELNQPSVALTAVNKIRERAGMPLYSSITRALVRKERKCELAFEGTRYFDLRRWRTAVTDLSFNGKSLAFYLDGDSFAQGSYNVLTAKYYVKLVNNADGSSAPYFQDKHYYLPIGQSRTSANPNLLPENPGYF